ncbi:hypothetical protein GF389_02615, partial [Candidatus Dojkabacteria bacterium]|nr:hypothetical protein [Candidatus Dojkabacteria bacterium]
MKIQRWASRIKFIPEIVSSEIRKDKPNSISIDVTNDCNLRCKHCYFFKEAHENDLSEKDLLNRIKSLKKKYPLIHAS